VTRPPERRHGADLGRSSRLFLALGFIWGRCPKGHCCPRRLLIRQPRFRRRWFQNVELARREAGCRVRHSGGRHWLSERVAGGRHSSDVGLSVRRSDQLLTDVMAGTSRVTVLRGDAGVGKSALLRYVSRRVSGWQVATAVRGESEMELAYSSLHQLCAPMSGSP
jgi:hypothetical protein